MNSYIALLRGINVGGNKKIKMLDLKALFISLGLTDVVTYIQSGNVIFKSEQIDLIELQSHIEHGINQTFGFDVPVQILTAKSLSELVTLLPFKELSVEQHGSQVMLCFLSSTPCTDQLEKLTPYQTADEQMYLIKNVLYIYYPNGSGRSKLTNTVIEKKLQLSATTRNLKTATKLVTLSQS